MRISLVDAAALLLPFAAKGGNAIDNASVPHMNLRTFKMFDHSFGGNTKPRLFSFDSEASDVDIGFDISIPFITVPLSHEMGENGETSPLVKFNPKSLLLVSTLTSILVVVLPLLSKTTTMSSYRSSDSSDWSEMGNAINDVIFGNNYVAPCIQRFICSAVSVATHTENPTSIDKIIDGLSSHKWFKTATNGTLIQEAVAIGRQSNRDCAHLYKNCLVSSGLLESMMNVLGIF